MKVMYSYTTSRRESVQACHYSLFTVELIQTGPVLSVKPQNETRAVQNSNMHNLCSKVSIAHAKPVKLTPFFMNGGIKYTTCIY